MLWLPRHTRKYSVEYRTNINTVNIRETISSLFLRINKHINQVVLVYKIVCSAALFILLSPFSLGSLSKGIYVTCKLRKRKTVDSLICDSFSLYFVEAVVIRLEEHCEEGETKCVFKNSNSTQCGKKLDKGNQPMEG